MIADALVGVSAPQRANASIIEREMRAAGFPAVVVAAAIINAYAESRLNASARSRPPEDSVGLFQLNARGAGAGMSVAERQDPVLNTRRIVEVAKGRAGAGMRRAWSAGDRTLGTYTRLWTTDIERPAAAAVRAGERVLLAARLLPAGVPGVAGTRPVWVWLLLAAVASGAVVVLARPRARRGARRIEGPVAVAA